jgi:N utilization substance protein B
MNERSKSRSAARLAAVQALYQLEMESTPLSVLLHEFHQHKRRGEIDGLITARLSKGWSLERLDRPMRQILRAGAYELIARRDVPTGTVISEYVDVAHAFYDKREAGFVNGLLDGVAKDVRK